MFADAQFYYKEVLRIDPLSQKGNLNLVNVYWDRKNWESARTLIETNLEREEDSSFWLYVAARHEFLQNGDVQTFTSGIEAIPDFLNDNLGKAKVELLKGNILPALNHLSEVKPGPFEFRVSGEYSLRPSSIELIQSLGYFEVSDEANWRNYSQKARDKLEMNVEERGVSYPPNLSELTICKALLGQLQNLDADIAKIRELSELPVYKLRYQVKCEM